MRISGAKLSADELFTKLKKFTKLDLRPSQALDDVNQVGDIVEFDMLPWLIELGQGDFSVQVQRVDSAKRELVVRTLGGHPLAEWRLWRIKRIGGDLLVETFSVEHPVAGWDWAKVAIGGQDGMYETWTNMLRGIVAESGGKLVAGADTRIEGEDRSDDVAKYLAQVE